jgi:hypothetical protein
MEVKWTELTQEEKDIFWDNPAIHKDCLPEDHTREQFLAHYVKSLTEPNHSGMTPWGRLSVVLSILNGVKLRAYTYEYNEMLRPAINIVDELIKRIEKNNDPNMEKMDEGCS